MPVRPSLTAEMVALIRAREQVLPEERRLVDDPFSGRFLEAAGSRLVRGGGVGGPVAWAASASFKLPFVGFAGLVLGRHRVMDRLLVTEARDGASQLVVLGAGYDARAYRFPPPEGPARAFEVDHPTLSSRKRELVAGALGAEPPHVRFVAVDFMSERLDERLLAHGFDRSVRTVFIWEGVTYYVTADVVRSTLATLRSISAPGSTVIFDAWARPPGVEGAVLALGRSVAGLFVRALSEPFLFHLDTHEAAADLLREAGFDVLFNYGAPELRAVVVERGRKYLHIPPHVVVTAGRA